jgi:cytosine/adenosine deaminase-related metal-dependent hydrolase
MVNHLGMSTAEVLRMATHGNRAMLRDGDEHDSLVAGKRADFIVVDGDPLADITVLQERSQITDVWMDGARIDLPETPVEIPRHQREASQGFWNRTYTREVARGYTPNPLGMDGMSKVESTIISEAAE